MLTISTQIYPKDNLSYFFSTGLNYNVHNADFTNLPKVSNYEYSKYGTYSNIKYNLGVGLNYKFENKLLDFFDSYSLSLNYNDYSALLNRKELLGNFIKENEYYTIYSEVPLDASLGAIGLKNNFWVNIVDNFDLGLILGANFIVNNSYSQKEVALNDKEYTFENGTNTREEYNGEIPELNSLLFNFGGEIRYNYLVNQDYSISPSLAYNYYLPSLVSGVDWALSSVNFNLALNYHPVKKVELPKPIEPEPILPEKPKEIVLHYYIDAFLNGNKIEKNSTINIDYRSVTEKEEYSILPIIYFQKSSSNLLNQSTSGLFELAINSLLENIASNIKKNNIEKVIIKTGKFVKADRQLFDERINKVLAMFEDLGIKKDIFKVEYNEVENLNYRYEELRQEEDKLSFSFAQKGQDLIAFTYFENTQNFLTSDNNILFKVNYNLDEAIVNSLKYKSNLLNNDREYNFKLEKDEKIDDFPASLTYFSNPISIRTNNLADTFNINLTYNKIDSQYVTNKIEGNKYRFILGYFDFDSYSFAAVDNNVLNFVKSSVSSKKKVKIIPMTDNIGEAVYNLELAKKRANSALNLLSLDKAACEIDLSNKQFFSNQHPYGRTLNRSVIIEISE